MSCPPPLEIERAFWTAQHAELSSRDIELVEHATTCDDCREIWDEITDLAELGATFERAWFTRREEVRAALLAKVGQLRPSVRPRRRWSVVPGLGAVALLAWWLSRPAPEPPPRAPEPSVITMHDDSSCEPHGAVQQPAPIDEVVTAAQVLDEFVRAFPRAARVGEARVMLGWMFVERGDHAAARAHFEAARTDSSARVRRSARKALATLAKKSR